jgi:hypothetical protein
MKLSSTIGSGYMFKKNSAAIKCFRFIKYLLNLCFAYKRLFIWIIKKLWNLKFLFECSGKYIIRKG